MSWDEGVTLPKYVRDAIMQRGEEAQRLLDTPAFGRIIRDLRADLIATEVVGTSAEETTRRERGYIAIRLLDTIVTTVQGFVSQRAQMLEAEAEAQDESDNEE
jgi:hypothetical protein